MTYIWCNDGKRNKKVWGDDEIPEGYEKGYILNQNPKKKMRRIRKLNEAHENKLKVLRKKLDDIYESKKEKWEQELLKKQKEITDF